MANGTSYSYCAGGKVVLCCPADGQACSPAKFVSASITPFHDEALEQASISMNRILKDLRSQSHQDLSFLYTPDGFLLAWTVRGIGPDGDVDELRNALGIGNDQNVST